MVFKHKPVLVFLVDEVIGFEAKIEDYDQVDRHQEEHNTAHGLSQYSMPILGRREIRKT